MFVNILCFGICIYLGFSFSNGVKKEKKFLQGIIRFNKNMIINLEYNKNSVTEFIKNYKDDDIKELLNCYVRQLKKGKEISLNLKNKQVKSELDCYFTNLGKSNASSQIEYVKGYEKIFQMQYEEFCTIGNKKILLYPKLGILLGGIIFIMLL